MGALGVKELGEYDSLRFEAFLQVINIQLHVSRNPSSFQPSISAAGKKPGSEPQKFFPYTLVPPSSP